MYVKKIDREARLIFGSQFFDFLFLGVWRRLSYFFGSQKFWMYYFWVNNCDAIYFFGFPILNNKTAHQIR